MHRQLNLQRPLLLAGLLLASVLRAQAVPLPHWTRQLEPTSSPVANLKLQQGTLEITLKEGRVARILEQGRPVGFYFTGQGEFQHLDTDKIGLATMAYNVERNTKLRPTRTSDSLHLQEEV